MMEEKKIKDLTGNRQERIAPKKPQEKPIAKQEGRQQGARRPFMRPQTAQHTEQMTEKLSGKQARESQPRDTQNTEPRPISERRPFSRPNQAGHTQGAAQSEPNGGTQKGTPRPDRERRAQKNHRRANAQGTQNGQTETKTAEKASQTQNEKKPAESRNGKQNQKERQDKNRSQKSRQGGGRQARANEQKQPTLRANVQPVTEAPAREREKTAESFSDEQLRKDGLWFDFDEPPKPAAEKAEPQEQTEVIGVQFRKAGKTYFFSPNGIAFHEGEAAIVETVRGMEYGEVLLGNRLVPSDEIVQPLKPVLRKATEADTAHYRENLAAEEQARPVFWEKMKENKLQMQLVNVEYTFDNSKLCFYFTAEGRVDFRELVKDLASVFRTRIELRQIGVRDEAKMCGGLAVCGRPFCCKSFLSDFAQVSIRMAKDQNLALSSSKISGSCGRLMCCLRYEQDTYEREYAELPRRGSAVDTPKGRATVLDRNFLVGTIKVSTDEDHVVRVFRRDEVIPVEPLKAKEIPEEPTESADSTETEETTL